MKRKTPVWDLARDVDWPEYVTSVSARLQKGSQTYGDKSFSMEPRELTRELQAEALDLCGWGFILWKRLRDIERAMESAGK